MKSGFILRRGAAFPSITSADGLLRLGVAACFIGHGAFGLLGKQAWLAYFSLFGIGGEWAARLMPVVGAIDVTIGVLALLWPARAVFLYAAGWALFTAWLRPLAGEGIAEALERAGNYGLPIAVLAATGAFGWRGWLQRVGSVRLERVPLALLICRLSTATLLAGHGLLALAAKPLLQEHFAMLGISSAGVRLLGATELAAAMACLILPGRALFFGIAGWKLLTESLFLWSGAPVWEFIERGGSYVAPLAAGLLLAPGSAGVVLASAPAVRIARIAVVLLAVALPPRSAIAQSTVVPRADAATIAQLREGGLVVACRHAITDHAREDRHPVDFDRPDTQRVLSEAGERQASELGAAIRRLNLPFGDVRSSPYQRTRRSAELMFGTVVVDSALFGGAEGKRPRVERLLSEPPAAQTNRVLMTHQGVLYPLFPDLKRGTIAEGDCIVAQPKGNHYTAIAHLKPEDWSR